MDHQTLLRLAQEWVVADPDPETAAAGERMIADGNTEVITEHFGRRVQFGTAGLRAALGTGPNRMNQALVRRVTQGLARYLIGEHTTEHPLIAVVGRDARHGSLEFSTEVARVLGTYGFHVHVFEEVVPTPIVAFATRALGAAVGVVITASHNPPGDNGYKVYLSNGALIIPPHDANISALIDDTGEPTTIREWNTLKAEGTIEPVPPSIWRRYEQGVLALRVRTPQPLRIVYTPMHGVGAATVSRVLNAAGYTDLHMVDSQAAPDGDFPTVAFPNPEDPEALHLAIRLATRVDADIIFANDPDADRLAVAIRNAQGHWTRLSGNEIGVLLADELLAHRLGGEERLVCTTIVSTALLSQIAKAHGASYSETLTGFKWIADQAIRHEESRTSPGQFIIGFEEALGFSIGSLVRDKDGISAMVVFADLAAHLRAQGATLWARLEELWRQHGVYATSQFATTLTGEEGRERIRRIMERLRSAPPMDIAGASVIRLRDVDSGTDHDVMGGHIQPLDLPKSNVLAWNLDDDSRVLARPSGTEPKLKLYFEVRTKVAPNEPIDNARARAQARLIELEEAMRARTGL